MMARLNPIASAIAIAMLSGTASSSALAVDYQVRHYLPEIAYERAEGGGGSVDDFPTPSPWEPVAPNDPNWDSGGNWTGGNGNTGGGGSGGTNPGGSTDGSGGSTGDGDSSGGSTGDGDSSGDSGNIGDTDPEFPDAEDIDDPISHFSVTFPTNGRSITFDQGIRPSTLVTIRDSDGNQLGSMTSQDSGFLFVGLNAAPANHGVTTNEVLSIIEEGHRSFNVTVPYGVNQPPMPEMNNINSHGIEFTGSVGGNATEVVVKRNNTELGRRDVDTDGTFAITMNPEVYAGEILEVTAYNVRGGPSDKLIVEVPSHVKGQDAIAIECYDPANARQVGEWQGCMGKYIVSDKAHLSQIISAGGSYKRSASDPGNVDPNKEWDLDELFVGQVTDMETLFHFNRAVTADISDWDVSNVTNMRRMFYRNHSFNQDIGDWDVSNVTNMASMFEGTGSNLTTFNQDIGDWDVSNVKNMSSMFELSHFNQDISAWDVTSVNTMSSMFAGSSNFSQTFFDQDISSWDVSNVGMMTEMFKYGRMSHDLTCWDVEHNPSNTDFRLNSAIPYSYRPLFGQLRPAYCEP